MTATWYFSFSFRFDFDGILMCVHIIIHGIRSNFLEIIVRHSQ